MQIKGFRVYVILAAIIITLAVLLTIQFAYQKYDVEQPLFKLYSQTKLVEKEPVLEQNGNSVKVILDVKKTDNLRQAYLDLNSYTKQVLGNTDFSIKLKDNRSKELEKAYYQSQFIIYEALSKGDFSRMDQVIQHNAANVGAESLVFIDSENVYVEFFKGDNYLYEIVPREAQTKNGAADQMGSGL